MFMVVIVMGDLIRLLLSFSRLMLLMMLLQMRAVMSVSISGSFESYGGEAVIGFTAEC
jgi:hypothetical protein